MWVFLDFDGVLHPEFSYAECFTKRDLVEETLLPFLGEGKFKIVLSTAWRSSFTFEDLKRNFSAEFACHMVGVTPELEGGFSKGGREEEINQWLEANASKDDVWIALDDRKELFTEDCPRLFWVDPEFGFVENDAERLAEQLRDFTSKKTAK
jgi:hypothetical protein